MRIWSPNLLFLKPLGLKFIYTRGITLQCVDKVLSSQTFLETRFQPLLDGLIFVKKGLGVRVLRMLIRTKGLYTGENF